MKTTASSVLVLIATSACAVVGGGPQVAGAAVEEAPRRHLRLLGGIRSLGSEWEPVEYHTVYGAEFDMQMDAGGLGFELGAVRSVEESGGFEARLTEYFAGARRTFTTRGDRLRPHFAGGLSIADYLFDDGTRRKDGYLLGFYVRGGVRYAMSRHWHATFDVRLNFGEFSSLYDRDQDLGGYQVLGGVGYSF